MRFPKNRVLLGLASGASMAIGGVAKATDTAALIEPASTRTFTTNAADVLDVYDSSGRTVSIGYDSVVTVAAPTDVSGALIVSIERGRVIATRGAAATAGALRVETADGSIELAQSSRLGVEVLEPGGFRAALAFGRADVTAGGASETLASAGREVRFDDGELSRATRSESMPLLANATLSAGEEVPLNGGDPRGVSRTTEGSAEDVQTDERQPGGVALGFATGDPARVERRGPFFGDIVAAGTTTGETGSNANSTKRVQAQNRIIEHEEEIADQPDLFRDVPRTPGGTTNTIFNSGDRFVQVTGDQSSVQPQRLRDSETSAYDLGYSFLTASNEAQGLFLAFGSLERIGDHGNESQLIPLARYGGDSSEAIAPVILPIGAHFNNDAQIADGLALPLDGALSVGDVLMRRDEDSGGAPLLQTSIYGNTHYRLVASGFACALTTPDADWCGVDYIDPDPDDQGDTPGEDDFFVAREPDNFLALEGRRLDATDERFFLAAGDIDGTYTPTFSVDRFYLTPGLTGYGSTGSEFAGVDLSVRAFLRNETREGIERLSDTGLLVVNPSSHRVNGGVQTGVLHADFGFAEVDGRQLSTISLTTGSFNFTPFAAEPSRTYAEVSGFTVGSSRLDDAASSVRIESPLVSTSVGGGNPALARDGAPGYVVLENFCAEPCQQPNSAATGGVERGSEGGDTRYALLRLATATGTLALGSRTTHSLEGWVAGFTEVAAQGEIGFSHLNSGNTSSGFALRTDGTANRVVATLSLASAEQTFTVNLGDTAGTGVFVDDDRFGLRSSSGPASAIVPAGLIDPSLFPDLAGATPTRIPDYQYLKWGFFFGDVQPGTGTIEHAHLVPWVAGVPAAPSDMPSSGTAAFGGHVVANVTDGDDIRTEFGTFANQWDFAARSGDVQMSFDGTDYAGRTVLRNSSAVFDGEIASVVAPGELPGRRGELVGNFAVGPTDEQGVIGRFSVRGDALSSYRAAGTFVGEEVQ